MTRRTWTLASIAGVAAAAVIGGVVALSSGGQPSPSAQEPAPKSATVEWGTLSDLISEFGVLTFRARSDGSPYAVINQARGTYTELPEAGAKVGCGDVLYRVDERPVLLLCGTVPSYRTLAGGSVGADVRQLNRNLHTLGYDAGFEIDPGDSVFTPRTAKALQALQRRKGQDVTGELELGDAVFLPDAVRVATLTGTLGGHAVPGEHVLDATSDTPEVQVSLDPSQQGAVKTGDRAMVTLPGNTQVAGTVNRLGSVARVPAGENANALAATIPTYISLDDPEAARGLDAAAVQVDITTKGVEDVLSVPVTALVGKAGGGFAVDVLRSDGRRELVTVTLGLFDTADGRVEVEGDLAEGDHVVVPSS